MSIYACETTAVDFADFGVSMPLLFFSFCFRLSLQYLIIVYKSAIAISVAETTKATIHPVSLHVRPKNEKK